MFHTRKYKNACCDGRYSCQMQRRHLYDKAYAESFNCVSEVFTKDTLDTSANVMLCAYENAEWVRFMQLHGANSLIQITQVVPLAQTLHESQRLSGIFINEVQVINLDADWRNFDGIPTFFQSCTRVGIACAVVFMTATLKVIQEHTSPCSFCN